MANLFNELTIKNVKFKNRIVMAPMCMYSSDETGMVKDFHLHHYAARAMGGVSMIIVEATAVEPRGVISERDLGIWSDEHIKGLKRLANTIKECGAVPAIQIGHAGRKSVYPGEIIAPSAIAFEEKGKRPIEMTNEQIKEVVLAFKEGVRRAVEAGFEALEIHGAHGYLISEFLSPLSNNREDKYGDTFENRARFLKEVLQGVREIYPKDKLLMLRVSAEDYAEEGNHADDIGELITLVSEYEVDLIDVSSGGVVPTSITPYPGYQVKFAESIKCVTGIMVMAGGIINNASMAEEIISSKRADLVFLGRTLLSDPFAPIKWSRELGEEIKIPVQYERGLWKG